jgi:hypothetical protein
LTDDEVTRIKRSRVFGALKPHGQITCIGRATHGRFRFETRTAKAVAAAFADGAQTLAALAARPEFAAVPEIEIVKAVQTLVAANQIAACATPIGGVACRAAPTRLTVPSSLNRWIITDYLKAPQRMTLAAPVAGTGITLDPVRMLLLGDLLERKSDGTAERVAAQLRSIKVLLRRGGKSIEGEDATRAELIDRRRAFLDRDVPLLVDLGVLAPAA